MIEIATVENLDVIPKAEEIPNSPWTHQVANGNKYSGAFTVKDREEADLNFLMYVGHRLRFDKVMTKQADGSYRTRAATWKEACRLEREQLAWMAFARDVGNGELYTMVDGCKVERTSSRDFVREMYGAELPERIRARKEADILEQVHLKREKAAKRRGEVYWRNVQKFPEQSETVQAPAQQGLF